MNIKYNQRNHKKYAPLRKANNYAEKTLQILHKLCLRLSFDYLGTAEGNSKLAQGQQS